MLFHLTLTHSQADCPGRRPAETPALIGPPDQLEAIGNELSVTSHSVVWGASCLLWAEPEHVAYALLEAPSLEAVERYIDALTPDAWSTRVLPVFALPSQLAAARQLLAAPASPFLPALLPVTPLEEPSARVTEAADDPDSAATLEGMTVESPAAASADHQPTPLPGELPGLVSPPTPPEPPLERRITREVPHVLEELPGAAPPPPPPFVAAPTVVQHAVQPAAAPLDPAPVPDSGAVTRFIARPTILDSLPPSSPASAPATPEHPELPAELVAPSEPPSPSESSTVILEPEAQRWAGLRLVASSGPAQGVVFEVGEAGATLGRLPENTICLTDGRLSRYHARIEFRDGAYWLSDLGSQNGTLVNDRPVTAAHRLQGGDSLQLGTTRLTVRLEHDD